MSFNSTKSFGRPGTPGKWKQPAGTTMIKYSYLGGQLWNGSPIIDRQSYSVSNDLVKVPNYLDGYTGYTAENCFFYLEKFSLRYSSTNWSSPGTSPRTQLDLQYPRISFPDSAEQRNEDELQESIDCNSQIISSPTPITSLVKYQDSNGQGVPVINTIARRIDAPTSETRCLRECILKFILIVPTDAVLEISETNNNGTEDLTVTKA